MNRSMTSFVWISTPSLPAITSPPPRGMDDSTSTPTQALCSLLMPCSCCCCCCCCCCCESRHVEEEEGAPAEAEADVPASVLCADASDIGRMQMQQRSHSQDVHRNTAATELFVIMFVYRIKQSSKRSIIWRRQGP